METFSCLHSFPEYMQELCGGGVERACGRVQETRLAGFMRMHAGDAYVKIAANFQLADSETI